MSQNSLVISDASGAAVLAAINAAFDSLASNNSGAGSPAKTYPHMWWADTANGVLKQRNATDTGWIARGPLAETQVIARSSNTALSPGDFCRGIVASGSWTQTFNPASVLGDGWFVKYRNHGTGVITLTPTAGETIDGSASIRLAPGESCDILCTGTTFYTIGRTASPTGGIDFFAMATPPAGWLKANGAAVSRTTYSALFDALVTSAGFSPQGVSISIATPAVFTKAAHGFSGGERLRLSTTGMLPTGLNTSSDYFVEMIDANTFYLQATPGGARIASSGTQSGSHSYLRSLWGLGDGVTTFNLPDLRGEFPRFWDDGRGVDSGRALGSAQAATRQPNLSVYATSATSGVLVSPSMSAYSGYPNDNFQKEADSIEMAATGNYLSTALSATGGTTTGKYYTARPRNVSLLACIKY